MKYIVQIDSYPQFVDGVLSQNLPMSPLYSCLMDRDDVKILRIRSRILNRGVDVTKERALTPHTFVSEHVRYGKNVHEIYLTCTLAETDSPDYESDSNIINKVVRTYMPEAYGNFEVVMDIPTFIPSNEHIDFKGQIEELSKAPLGQLGTPIAILNTKTTTELVHLFHMDPRSYTKTCKGKFTDKKLNMYVPGASCSVHIYHPMNMKDKLAYRSFQTNEVCNLEQWHKTYPLWLWRVDLFNMNNRPVYNNQLHMFVRFNRTLTEASLKGYDKLTHEIFLNGGVDKYHLYVTTTNKEKWIETNKKILEKISPDMAFDWKGIKDCGESGFSYVSLRSKKYPFITPKFLELLSNGIVPFINVWTSETMEIRDLFPSELYVQELVDIAANMNVLADPVVFKRVIDNVYEKLENAKQPLLEVLNMH